MRRLLLALALLAALAVAGCGSDESTTSNSESPEPALATTEGVYLDINHLKYQIQLSRYLNPTDIEDEEYLRGLPEGEPKPNGTNTWFGIWIRVQNVTDVPHPIADNWEVRDTLGAVYRPIPIDKYVNVFALHTDVDVPPNTVLPLSSSAAGQGPIQGSMLLFKIRNESLQNRPLQLVFRNGVQGGGEGVYDIDV
jgi:hypothetical protein